MIKEHIKEDYNKIIMNEYEACYPKKIKNIVIILWKILS